MLVDLKKAETRKARSTGNVKQKQNKKAVFEGLIRKIRVWRRRGPNFGKKKIFLDNNRKIRGFGCEP